MNDYDYDYFNFIFCSILGVHLFVWITQSTHIPTMNIEWDRELSWFRSQLETTCNYHPNWFNDWFTGHNNFQIEHQWA